MSSEHSTRIMALFCDFENVALGVRDTRYSKFDIEKVLERLLLKGNIVVKKAYCDWDRYKEFKTDMHEASFELIEIPHVRQSGKNSADIRLVVDALDLCYTKSHVDTFVIISGDSDFSPLVSKLRENNKTVIGVGVKNSSSDLLISGCDEFIFYDDLVREPGGQPRRGRKRAEKPAAEEKQAAPATAPAPEEPPAAPAAAPAAKRSRSRRRSGKGAAVSETAPAAGSETPAATAAAESAETPAARTDTAPEDERRQEGLDMVMATLEDLFNERGQEDKVWASMVKQTLKRLKPGFNERYHGFRTFAAMLEELQSRQLLELELDGKSGSYIVRSVHG
jgi:uncharacterized protein (TIGR00288 family)